jgi:hypothetical protein
MPTGKRSSRPDNGPAEFLSRSSTPWATMRADSWLGPNAFSRTVSRELEDAFVCAMSSAGARNNNQTARQQKARRGQSRLPPPEERMSTAYKPRKPPGKCRW